MQVRNPRSTLYSDKSVFRSGAYSEYRTIGLSFASPTLQIKLRPVSVLKARLRGILSDREVLISPSELQHFHSSSPSAREIAPQPLPLTSDAAVRAV